MTRFKYDFPDSIQPGGPVTVVIDGDTFPSAGPIADDDSHIGEHVTTPPAGHGSELSQMVESGWTFRNDGDGKMYDRAGTLLSVPEPTDPLPADPPGATIEDQVAYLLKWQIDHPSFHNQLNADGNDFGQPGIEPKAMYGTGTGRLTLRADAPVPKLPTVVTVPAVANQTTAHVRQAPPASGGIELHFPAGDYIVDCVNVPTGLARLRVAPQIGGDVAPGSWTVECEGLPVSGDLGGMLTFAVGSIDETATRSVPTGSTITAKVHCEVPSIFRYDCGD